MYALVADYAAFVKLFHFAVALVEIKLIFFDMLTAFDVLHHKHAVEHIFFA